MLERWARRALAFVYPPTCVLCDAPGTDDLDICSGCRQALPRIDRACERCGVALAVAIETVCGDCRRRPPAFDVAHAAFHYRSPVDHLIGRFKFHAQLSHGRLLGLLMAEALDRGDPPECLVPVPLHPRRMRERGFNQSLELARVAAHRLRVPLEPGIVARVKATPPQMSLPARIRRTNTRGAFRLRGAAVASRIAIVDDVMTTGSTVHELARVLRRAGAEHIAVWCVARAD